MKVLLRNPRTVKPKSSIGLGEIKRRCKENPEIKTITKLATLIPCSVTSVYFAIERPSRYSRVYTRILEILK